MTRMKPRQAAALLAAERQRLVAAEAELVAEHQAIVEASDHVNLDDEHDPEGATVGFERARAASLLRHVRGRLSDFDDALDRLRTGAYGTCQRCGQAIGPQRLGAHPTAMTCIGCAERRQAR